MGPIIFGFQKWLRVACFCSWWWHRLGFQIRSAHRCAGRWASRVTDSEREIGQGREEVQLTRSTNSAARDLKNKWFKVSVLHRCHTPKVISPHLPGIWFPNLSGDTRVIPEWPRWGVEEVRLARKSLMSFGGRVCLFSLLISSSGGSAEESMLGLESGPWVGLWPWPGSHLQVTFWIKGGWSHHPAPRGWQEGKMKACVEVPGAHWAHLGLDERDGPLAGSCISYLHHFIIWWWNGFLCPRLWHFTRKQQAGGGPTPLLSWGMTWDCDSERQTGLLRLTQCPTEIPAHTCVHSEGKRSLS